MGVAAWLVETHIEYGVLNTTTLQQIGPALTGGCFSLFTSLIITVLLSLLYPQNYDWANMKDIAVFNDISADVSFGPFTHLSLATSAISCYFCGTCNMKDIAVFNYISADVYSGPFTHQHLAIFAVPGHHTPIRVYCLVFRIWVMADNGYGCRIRRLRRRQLHWSFSGSRS